MDFNSKNFEIGLSSEELQKRTHKDYLNTKKMLDVGCIEYEQLLDSDKRALIHLVKAAEALNAVYLKQDNEHNVAFKEFLVREVKGGSEDAKMALRLFEAQKGIFSVDSEANRFCLKKGEIERPGKALYPMNITKEEFHNILINMLKDEDIEEVSKILNQRSIVKRRDNKLYAVDYVEEFLVEFGLAADELEKAAKLSSNSDFNEFLQLQANALRKADPMLDAYADKKWAELQDTPLEFTITRENYEDELTGTVVENEELNSLLSQLNITPIPKDMIGVRVGIVNQEGTAKLLEIKDYLPELAKNMPYSDCYTQNISDSSDVKQTMVDVDLVIVTGDSGAYRGGITLAENLPNDDKLSLTIGGGRRNAYHRQIRQVADYDKLQKRLDETLAIELHEFYENEADHWFTIGHENAHSLGPNSGTEALGKYRSIIEENKADMTSLAMLDLLVELGMYSAHQRNQIITSFVVDNFLKAEPNLSQAHRVRSVMQTKFLMDNNAVYLNEDNKINLDFDKIVPVARKMLEQIIDVQISKDFTKAEQFVLDNFKWTDEMELIANKLKVVSKTLNGEVIAPLAEHLLTLDNL